MIPSTSPRTPDPLPSPPRAEPGAIAPVGELVEVLGSAVGSVLAAACAHVQAREPVAWVVAAGAVPHPGDLAAAGVRCEQLAVVHAAETRAARAAELLLSNGGFGLVVVDGCGTLPDRSVARLRALCRKHRARLLVAPWTRSESHPLARPRLGSTITLRLAAHHRRQRLELRWTKNKAGLGAALPSPSLRLPVGCIDLRTGPAEAALPSPRPLASIRSVSILEPCARVPA